jgi:hypothetical protein
MGFSEFLYEFFRASGVALSQGAQMTMRDYLKTNSYASTGLQQASRSAQRTQDRVTYIHSVPVQAKSTSEITVIFTSFESTQKALLNAGALAMRLGTHVAVIAAQVVPYPLPLDKPPVPYGFIFRRFESIVDQFPVKTEFRVFLCRDQLQCIKSLLSTSSPVVMGVRKKLWPTRDLRLARKLRRTGYEVILVETE